MNEAESESYIKGILRKLFIVLCTGTMGLATTFVVFSLYIIFVYGPDAFFTVWSQKQQDDHLFYVFMGCLIVILGPAAALGGHFATILLKKLGLSTNEEESQVSDT